MRKSTSYFATKRKSNTETKPTTQLFEKLSLTTTVIFFFFLCGSLYLIGFWLHFSFDVTSFLNTLDIPKAAVQSIANLYFSSASFFFMFVQLSFIVKLKNKIQGTIAILSWGIICFRALDPDGMIFSYAGLERDVYFFYFGLQSIFILYFYKVLGEEGLSKLLRTTFTIASWFPIYCFAGGLLRGTSIKLNKNISIVENVETQDSAYKNLVGKKLVGFVGDKIVLSSVDNAHFYLVNQSANNILRFHSATK